MKYKHIVLDIDGTLLDTEYAILCSLKDTIKELQNRDVELKDLTFVLGIPSNVALEKLSIKDTRQANEIWNINMLRYVSSIKLFDGITELLKELKKRSYSLGIVTSKNNEEFKNDFEPYKITGYFDTVICVTDSQRPKPFPDPLLAYMQKTGTLPQEIIYIGDTYYDSQCAHLANIDFALAKWGNTNNNKIPAKYLLKYPEEILEIIQ